MVLFIITGILIVKISKLKILYLLFKFEVEFHQTEKPTASIGR